jgi:hypothetical protein
LSTQEEALNFIFGVEIFEFGFKKSKVKEAAKAASGAVIWQSIYFWCTEINI